MKKILHFTTVHHYKDTRIFYRYCQSLCKLGFDVSLLCCVENDFIDSSVQVHALGEKRGLFFRILFLLPLSIFKILKIKPDIIHFHDPEILLIAPLLRIFGFKLIYDIHEDNYQNILQKKSIPQVFRFPLALVVDFIEKCSKYIARHIIAERYYSVRFPSAIEALNYPMKDYSGAYLDDLNMIDDNLRSSLPISFDDQYSWYIYSGNITLERGAIAQLDVLLQDNQSALFYIGKCSSSVYDEIKQWVLSHNINANRMIVVGVDTHVPQSIIDFYQKNYKWKAGLAIFPISEFYIQKELTKFFEYYRFHIPILCTDTPVWSKFMIENNAGIVFSDGWLMCLNNMIATVYENDTKKFTWQSEMDRVLNLYDKM